MYITIILAILIVLNVVLLSYIYYFITKDEIEMICKIRSNLVNAKSFEYRHRYKLLLDLNNRKLLDKFKEEMIALNVMDYEYDDDINLEYSNIYVPYPAYVLDDSSADDFLERNILKFNKNIKLSTIKRAIKLYYKKKEGKAK